MTERDKLVAALFSLFFHPSVSTYASTSGGVAEGVDYTELTNQIRSLIVVALPELAKEAGYKSPEEIQESGIITKIAKQPIRRGVRIHCPSCGHMITRIVKIGEHNGTESCLLCGNKFTWEEEK